MRKVRLKSAATLALATVMMATSVQMPGMAQTVKAETTAQKRTAALTLPEATANADGYVYGTVDMPYADFYYGELNDVVETDDTTVNTGSDKVDIRDSYDAVTSATTGKSTKFPTTYFSEGLVQPENVNGVSIFGIKSVPIRIKKALYDNIKTLVDTGSNTGLDSLSTFTVSDTALSEYKTLNADGTFTKMVTETQEDTDATTSFTTESVWGDYQLSVENLGTDKITVSTENMLGVIFETSDGKKYGMLHLDNLWLQPGEISFVTTEGFVEPHNCIVPNARYTDITNKTITKVTYLLKDAPDLVINTNHYVKTLNSDSTKGTASSATYTGNDTKINVALENAQAHDYTLAKIEKGSRHPVTVDSSKYKAVSTGTDQFELTMDKSLDAAEDYYAVFTSATHGDIKVQLIIAKADQVISGSSAYTKTYGDSNFRLDATATAGTLTYQSSNEKVVTVDANGNVAIKGAGTADIKVATTGDDNYNGAEKTVTINVNKKNGTITGASTFTKAYGSKAFSLGVKATGSVSYKSSNTSVVTVSAKGLVTIKGTGMATITVASTDSNYNQTTKSITIKVVPKQQKISSVKSSKKKQLSVTWKKDTQATGYQIQVSTKKNFKNKKTVTVKSYKTYKKVIKSLKSKKKYYVRVRSYKTSGSTKLYGAFSATKVKKCK